MLGSTWWILGVRDTDYVPMILLANKTDLDEQRVVEKDEGE